MLTFFFLKTLTAIVLADSQFLPSNVFSVAANDLALAHVFYQSQGNLPCGVQLAYTLDTYQPANFPRLWGLRDDNFMAIANKAAEVRNLVVSATATALLQSMQHPEGNFGQMPVLMDAFEEAGTSISPALSLFRGGLVEHFQKRTPRPGRASMEREFELFFYLLKFNAIPEFVLSRYFTTNSDVTDGWILGPQADPFLDTIPVFRPEVYFEEGRISGFYLQAQDLFEHEAELLALPVLRQLKVRATLSDLIPVLTSPVLRRVQSLSLELVGSESLEEVAIFHLFRQDEDLTDRIRQRTKHISALEIILQGNALSLEELYFWIRPDSLKRLSLQVEAMEEGATDWCRGWLRHLDYLSIKQGHVHLIENHRRMWHAISTELNPKLSVLRLDKTVAEPQDFGELLRPFLPVQLKELHLGLGAVRRPLDELIAHPFLWDNVKVFSLEMFGQYMDYSAPILSLLRRCEHLEKLSLWLGIEPEQTLAILSGLPNETLTALRLPGSDLSFTEAEALSNSKALSQLKTIEARSVRLENCVLRALKKLKGLREVHSEWPRPRGSQTNAIEREEKPISFIFDGEPL